MPPMRNQSQLSNYPTWKDLSWWKSEDYQKVRAKIYEDNVIGSLLPQPKNIFRPLISTPLKDVKVVFIGNHPHQNYDASDGLALSSSKEVEVMGDLPATTLNFLTELVNDTGIKQPVTGNLNSWTYQGVLLWNWIPTCLVGQPSSHYQIGWDSLSDEIIDTVYLNNPKAVFVFLEPIKNNKFRDLPDDANKIRVPGPYQHTAYHGFFGSKVFTRVNDMLKKSGLKPINWTLPSRGS